MNTWSMYFYVECKRVFASGVNINAKPNINAGSLQPASEATRSAKQINCANAIHAVFDAF